MEQNGLLSIVILIKKSIFVVMILLMYFRDKWQELKNIR